ncbi:nitric oxide reductase activation protein NorD [Cucumibacter marinus]|uniref:nitric oxide reductase activation protein NorD n=1 Tax=Cucumibacter marinus TaxID=1121252 RepID=UPI00041C7FA2|nr:VWA domain-containing protein [Cucumibacter marinus]
MKPTATAALDLLDRTGLTRAVTAPVLTTVGEHLDRRLFADWSSNLERLVDCGGRGALVLDFIRASAACARRFPPEDCVALSRSLCALTKDLGPSEMAAITQHLPAAISAIRVDDGVRYYLSLLEDIADEAPGALAVFVERTPMLLTHVRQEGLRAFVRAGLTSERDTEKLHHYFALADKSAWQVIEQEGGEVSLGEIEGRLKSLATVLWKGRPFIRPLPGNSALGGQRRASFDRHMIRLPQSFSGYRASEAEQLYKAAIAHIGAHWAHTPHRVEIKSLKPVQVALVALLEDAKAEILAGREYPGLLRLWRRFHTAEAAGPALAEPLMARLSRALIDPDYEDDNSWVQKGKKLFFDAEPDWDDPAVLRRIGGLLGNDIGQMRLQFNAKTYVVQPAYRDDNMGILDFGDIPPEMNEDDEEVFDSVQLNQVENPDQPQDRDKQESGGDANSQVSSIRPVDSDHGIPIAKLPEWDYATGATRRDWVTIMEYRPVASRASIIDQVLDRHATEHRRIEALISQARVGRAIRLKRQPEGDSLDLDAAIRAMIDRRAGVEPDTRVYQSSALMHRDLSVLVLLDISESTKDIVTGTHSTVFSAERAATALLAEAMAGLNDPFAIHAFCSDSRKELRYYRIKDFGERYGDDAKSRLAGLRPGLSTRMGAALRQAAHEIGGQLTHRRLVLVVTDGEPSDIDVSDRKYLVEDARKAVHELAHQGINVFAVGLDSEGEGYLSRIFGRRNVAQISNVAALPHKLPMLYLRLTA